MKTGKWKWRLYGLLMACVAGLAPAMGGQDAEDAGFAELESETESERVFEQPLEELPLGDHPVPQEAGEWQVGVSALYLSGSEDRTTDLALEIEYGLTDRLQIETEIPYEWQGEEAEGFPGVELGLQGAILETDRLIASLALQAELTGEEPAWEAAWLVGLNLDPVTLFLGLGYEFGEEEEVMVDVALACPCPVGTAILEVSGELGEEEDEVYLTPGLARKWAENGEWLVGIPVGLTNDSADWGVVARLTFEF